MIIGYDNSTFFCGRYCMFFSLFDFIIFMIFQSKRIVFL